MSSTSPGINALVFAAPSQIQPQQIQLQSLVIYQKLAADTVFGFTISTVNNGFGWKSVSQVSLTGSVTIAVEPSINLTSGSSNLAVCR